MQLIEIITEVLETGLMPMAVERRMHQLLDSGHLNETEMQVVDQLIDALSTGKIQPVA